MMIIGVECATWLQVKSIRIMVKMHKIGISGAVFVKFVVFQDDLLGDGVVAPFQADVFVLDLWLHLVEVLGDG